MTTPSPSSDPEQELECTITNLNMAIAKIDSAIEFLHQQFHPFYGPVAPALHSLSVAREGLEQEIKYLQKGVAVLKYRI